MSSSSIDAKLVRRVATRVANAVRALGPGDHPVLSLSGVDGEVYLPEVNIFNGPSWMLPKIRPDLETLAYVYECFAEQPLGTVERPGHVIESVLRSSGVSGGQGAFNLRRDPCSWFTPAVRLVAYASLFRGAVLETEFENLRFAVTYAGTRFEVTPEGLFSNITQGIVKAQHPANDVVNALMSLPATRTSNKILVALDEMLPNHSHELRILAYGFGMRILNPTEFVAGLSTKVSTLDIEAERRKRLVAAEHAARVLEHVEDGVIKALYGVVVPHLYSSREFVRTFGSTASNRKPRKLRDRTREEWAERIRIRADEDF